MPRIIGLGFLAALTIATLQVSGGPAFASHVRCGDVVTEDTTLDSDLIDCPGDGIVIGADDITLDLDGHTIDGDGDPRAYRGCDTGIANGRIDNCSRGQPGHNGVTIRGGTVREFAHGVQVSLADRNSLSQLRVHENSGFGGIVTSQMSNGHIEGNRAIGNNSAGIAIYEPEERITIAGNVVGRNSGNGLELAGGVAGDRLEGNVAFGNDADGFFVVSARGLLITNNRSFGNRGAGVTTFEGQSHIESNRVWNNGSGGIAVTGDDSQIVGNRAFDNRGVAGIAISAEAGGNVVASNDLRNNLGHGIFHSTVVDERGMVIARNHSNGNGEDGIHVRRPALDAGTSLRASELRGNHTDRNGDDGIDVKSQKVALYGNRAIWNVDLGIEAVAGTIDGGRNRAFGNGNPLQCLGVVCK
jgi:parallel beta-helix repeat protein